MFYGHAHSKALAKMCPCVLVNGVWMKPYGSSGSDFVAMVPGMWLLLHIVYLMEYFEVLVIPVFSNTFHLPGTLLRDLISFSHLVLWSRPCCHPYCRDGDVRAERGQVLC